MNRSIVSMSSIMKIATAGLITGAIVLGGGNFAMAETRTESVDSVTDWLFYNVNPQLNRRKIGPNEHTYVREWNVIRQVINEGLVFEAKNRSSRSCLPEWYFPNNDEALKDRLADAIFYNRHPEMRGQKLRATDTTMIRKWRSIRNAMGVAYC